MPPPSFTELGRPRFPRSDTLSLSGPLKKQTSNRSVNLSLALHNYGLKEVPLVWQQQGVHDKYDKCLTTDSDVTLLEILIYPT